MLSASCRMYPERCIIWRRLQWNPCARPFFGRSWRRGGCYCVCCKITCLVKTCWDLMKIYQFGAYRCWWYLFISCDAYADIVHTLTDSQLAEFEAVDPFIEQFNANLDKQIASFESVLHKENFQVGVCSLLFLNFWIHWIMFRHCCWLCAVR